MLEGTHQSRQVRSKDSIHASAKKDCPEQRVQEPKKLNLSKPDPVPYFQQKAEVYTRLRAVDHIGDMALFLRHFEDRGASPYI